VTVILAAGIHVVVARSFARSFHRNAVNNGLVGASAGDLSISNVAAVRQDDPLLGGYPEAQFIVRVRVREVFPNCPRYIHRMQRVSRSEFVPRQDCQTPVPDWKRSDWAVDVLPQNDPARDPSR